MNTVLFVNATIGFSENLFLVSLLTIDEIPLTTTYPSVSSSMVKHNKTRDIKGKHNIKI